MKTQFIRNQDDDNHCLQASLMMAASAVGHPISWVEVDQLSSYDANYYTWAPTVIEPFSKVVPGSKLISSIDYQAFSEHGESYLKQSWSLDWFTLQQNHSSPNFKKEQEAAKYAIAKGLIQKKTCKLADLENLLKDNLIVVLVDAGKLEGKDYSSGHYVLVYGSDDKNFTIHDSGLPGHKKWNVDKKSFISSFRGDVIVVPKKI